MSSVFENTWQTRIYTPANRIGEAAGYAQVATQTVSRWQPHSAIDTGKAAGSRENSKGISYIELIEIAVVSAMSSEGVKLNVLKFGSHSLKLRLKPTVSTFYWNMMALVKLI